MYAPLIPEITKAFLSDPTAGWGKTITLDKFEIKVHLQTGQDLC